MQCRSTSAGHNLDPAAADDLMAAGEPKRGFLRLIRFGPLIVWFPGSYPGYGYDRLFWSHDSNAVLQCAAKAIERSPELSLAANVGPLDPDVWVPTIAAKVLAKQSAPNYTPTAPVHVWEAKLISVDQTDAHQPALFSIAPIDAATTCDRADVLGVCPNCGSGQLKKVVMGYPRFDIVGDPNYELGGCVIDRRHPRGDYVCASCGHERTDRR